MDMDPFKLSSSFVLAIIALILTGLTQAFNASVIYLILAQGVLVTLTILATAIIMHKLDVTGAKATAALIEMLFSNIAQKEAEIGSMRTRLDFLDAELTSTIKRLNQVEADAGRLAFRLEKAAEAIGVKDELILELRQKVKALGGEV